MTARDLATWHAVYAVAWFQAPSFEHYGGALPDRERAQLAATHADRAVAALQQVRPEES